MSSLIVKVSRISEITPHPNADRLEIAKVRGWYCIVGKGEYKVNDLCMFLPPDTVCTEEMVVKYNLTFLKNGRRIRTLKLRGFISQGLVLPLPEGNWKEDDDLVSYLGVTKWEPPTTGNSYGTRNQTSKKKKNPNFDKYTDIENIKNYNSVFTEEDDVVITEKIHGTNFRCGLLKRENNGLLNWLKTKIFGEYEFVYGSHNVQLREGGYGGVKEGFYENNVYYKIVRKYKLKEKLEKDTIIYGEIYGEGIQDLTYGLKDIDFKVFDVKRDGKYLDYSELLAYCSFFELPVVPQLYKGKFNEELLKQHTEGNSTICPFQIREGCVVKPLKEINHRTIGRKILKSINPEYLLREKGTENK